jgi:hypothetical protein
MLLQDSFFSIKTRVVTLGLFASAVITAINMLLLRESPGMSAYLCAFVISGLGGMLMSYYLYTKLHYGLLAFCLLAIPICDMLLSLFVIGLKDNPSMVAVAFLGVGLLAPKIPNQKMVYLLIPLLLLLAFYFSTTAPVFYTHGITTD